MFEDSVVGFSRYHCLRVFKRELLAGAFREALVSLHRDLRQPFGTAP